MLGQGCIINVLLLETYMLHSVVHVKSCYTQDSVCHVTAQLQQVATSSSAIAVVEQSRMFRVLRNHTQLCLGENAYTQRQNVCLADLWCHCRDHCTSAQRCARIELRQYCGGQCNHCVVARIVQCHATVVPRSTCLITQRRYTELPGKQGPKSGTSSSCSRGGALDPVCTGRTFGPGRKLQAQLTSVVHERDRVFLPGQQQFAIFATVIKTMSVYMLLFAVF
jgi:hypothetical protein